MNRLERISLLRIVDSLKAIGDNILEASVKNARFELCNTESAGYKINRKIDMARRWLEAVIDNQTE